MAGADNAPKLPNNRNLPEWTFSNVILAITGAQISDLAAVLKGTTWINLNKDSVDVHYSGGALKGDGGYHAFDTQYYGMDIAARTAIDT